MKKYDFSGIWRSSYHYHDEPHKVVDTEHYVTMTLKGNGLIAESLPNTEGSYLMARFSLDGPVATGTYHSQNSPRSSMKGALYYGAAQLMLDEDGKALRGMGVGFSKDMKIKATDWELVHIGQHVPSSSKDKTAAKSR
jgi:hypothetical protein